jgi:uracil-DNA glycosylase family 4
VTVDIERRAAFLEEMGLGPQWVRRSGPAGEEETQVAAPAATVSIADVTPTTPAGEPAADAFAPLPEEVPAATSAWDSVVSVPVAAPRSSDATAADIGAMGWDELAQTVSACTRCGLCKGRTRTAFGVGDRKARWLFIGEGPGREEDMRGEPFVGRAGQLLDNMLAAIKLARGQNAYIANIVKCRPTDEGGKDRRPSADESAACLPYLERQIALIQPDVIVALGKTAAVSLLGLDPETPVSSLRGKVHRYAERPLVVTYHPAYLLRTPADKKKTWADLCLAMGEYAKRGETA